MREFKILAAPLLVLALAGCLDTDGERALAGAAGGAVVADALGGSAAAGAVVGGAAGLLCDDAGVCN
ncbi:hypothetical protein [Actibacterium lipolyticum]|uniref:hypothetical protein n=1 Tax=Actibacterium lipolyticum TaxID=1524263 RepID=UPI000BB454DA|nr:hypothetical protein [Actibacterium lipolyticum]